MIIKGSLLLSAPLLSIFGRKKNSPFGPKFDDSGDKQVYKIKFKFYNPKKAHPCVISRLLSHHAQKSVQGLTCRLIKEKKV